MSLVIVDTGCANLASVKFAFDRLGVSTEVSENADVITAADRVIIPGVGSAQNAMQSLSRKELVPVIKGLQQPVLGICLGMQLMFSALEESVDPADKTDGLGFIDGQVLSLETGKLPNPHMGWNQLEIVKDDPLLAGVKSGDYTYFVHSYAAPIGDYTLAACKYGANFSAVVRHKNVWGCQFHPERSAAIGAKILKNFSDIKL